MVPVADCGGEQFSAHPKSEMKMAEYLKYWSSLLKEREGSDSVETLLYLKDWHLAKYVHQQILKVYPAVLRGGGLAQCKI